jgi:tRNA A37 threonylcarbamoyladenosine synthetase subunit TsaC/SUA5/YrdC
MPDEQLLDDPREIDNIYKGQVDLVVDGGVFLPEPSSIISLLEDEPNVIRVGKGDVTPFG